VRLIRKLLLGLVRVLELVTRLVRAVAAPSEREAQEPDDSGVVEHSGGPPPHWKALVDRGPPRHWLEVVRKRAPQLLRPEWEEEPEPETEPVQASADPVPEPDGRPSPKLRRPVPRTEQPVARKRKREPRPTRESVTCDTATAPSPAEAAPALPDSAARSAGRRQGSVVEVARVEHQPRRRHASQPAVSFPPVQRGRCEDPWPSLPSSTRPEPWPRSVPEVEPAIVDATSQHWPVRDALSSRSPSPIAQLGEPPIPSLPRFERARPRRVVAPSRGETARAAVNSPRPATEFVATEIATPRSERPTEPSRRIVPLAEPDPWPELPEHEDADWADIVTARLLERDRIAELRAEQEGRPWNG